MNNHLLAWKWVCESRRKVDNSLGLKPSGYWLRNETLQVSQAGRKKAGVVRRDSKGGITS
jgi:hypothetical protein